MREIKFRAWDKVNGMFRKQQMIREPLISKSDVSKGKVIFVNDVFKDEEFIWMQYTGLKDKNGVEIYEGDYLETKKFKNVNVYYEKGAFKVEYKQNEVRIIVQNLGDFLSKNKSSKVIGNIYENPELLEVQNV